MTRGLLLFHLPQAGDEEARLVGGAIRSGGPTIGPKVKEFEQEFAAYVGERHAVAVGLRSQHYA